MSFKKVFSQPIYILVSQLLEQINGQVPILAVKTQNGLLKA